MNGLSVITSRNTTKQLTHLFKNLVPTPDAYDIKISTRRFVYKEFFLLLQKMVFSCNKCFSYYKFNNKVFLR